MKTIQKNKKRKSFELRRLVALLCALVVPALYIISIILIITENPYGRLFLAISLGTSMVFLPIVYLATKLPKDIGEMYGNVLDMMDKAKHKEKHE